MSAGVRELVRWVVEVDAKGASQGLGEVATAAKRVQVEAAKTDRSFAAMGESGKKVASLLGGPFATLGDVVFELGGKASTAGGALGALGGFAAGAVVGVGALTYASVELASAAEAAAERLEKQGLAALIPDEARASVERYRDATEGLRNQMDLLGVSLGGPLLDSVASVADALAGLVSVGRSAYETLSPLIDKMAAGYEATSMLRTGLLLAGSGGLAAPGLVANSLLNAGAEEAVAAGEAARAETEATRAAKRAADEEAGRALREAEAEEARRREAERRGQQLLQDMRRKAHEEQQKHEHEALAAAKATNAELLADSKRILGEIDKMFQTRLQVDSARTSAGIGGLLNTIGIAEAGYGGMAVSGAASTIDVSKLPGAGSILGGIAKGLGGAAVGSLAGASGLGGLGGLAAAGPVGLGIAAAAGAPALLGTLDGAVGTLTQQFEDLPDALSHALETTLPHLLESLPALASAFLEAVAQLPVVLVQALPEILTGLVTSILEAIKNILGFGGGDRSPREIATSRGLTAIQTGDSTALRDAAEDMLRGGGGGRDRSRARQGLGRRAEAQRGGASELHVHGVTDPRELMRRIRRELGGDYGASYATGDSL